jgi:hypothetical protein
MLLYPQSSRAVIQLMIPLTIGPSSVKVCITVDDLDSEVIVFNIIVHKVVFGIIDPEHMPVGDMAVDQISNFTVCCSTFHYQLPSSIHIRTVTNNQVTYLVFSLGHSLTEPQAGIHGQWQGFSVIITQIPLYLQ